MKSINIYRVTPDSSRVIRCLLISRMISVLEWNGRKFEESLTEDYIDYNELQARLKLDHINQALPCKA
jgi:hypothetical protein